MRMFIWVGCIVASAVAIWFVPVPWVDDAGKRDRSFSSVLSAEPTRQSLRAPTKL